jgi:hypothetical protein
MNGEPSKETVEARAQFILEYTNLTLPGTLEALKRLSRVGVTFTDKQKEMIQENIRQRKEQEP